MMPTESSRAEWVREFARAEKLPSGAISGALPAYLAYAEFLADWLAARAGGDVPLLGISGAQGSGKTTLARCLQLALERAGFPVALLSLDDFYLSRSERRQLAATVHPLLAVRGVPGTHDVAALQACLRQLRAASAAAVTRWPSFDKASDDRNASGNKFSGRPALILLEGWCIGVQPQSPAQLVEPCNELEAREDADGTWRRCVNEALAGPYRELFALLDALCFLQVPSFEAARRWRGEQERKLYELRGRGMAPAELDTFMQYYERLTRHALASLPACADWLFVLDDEHRVAGSGPPRCTGRNGA